MSFYTGIECDKCGLRMDWRGVVTAKWVKIWARDSGWSIGKQNNATCPECMEAKKQEAPQ